VITGTINATRICPMVVENHSRIDFIENFDGAASAIRVSFFQESFGRGK
jgi:hypothetical protein